VCAWLNTCVMSDKKPKVVAIVGVSLPIGLIAFARDWSAERGKALSAVVKEALAKYVGYKGDLFVQNGGDRSMYRNKSDLGKQAALMREAKARKRKGLRGEEGVYAEAERRRRKARSSNVVGNKK